MPALTQVSVDQIFQDLFGPALKAAADEAIKRAIDHSRIVVEGELRKMAANLILNVLSTYSAERHGEILRIEIKLP